MVKRACAALVALLLLIGCAYADWSAPDLNLEKYTEKYAETIAKYKRLQYGASTPQVASLKEALAKLGFFPYLISENYYRTLETAIRLFVQQMRLDGDGREITPLVQAMILDTGKMPAAIVPVIDVLPYSGPGNDTNFAPYTYAQISRNSVLSGAQVSFRGKITAKAKSGGESYYAVQMEGDPAKRVYVAYQSPQHTTLFQPGDDVLVFGVTQGRQSLPQPGMEEEALFVKADRVGYSK